MYNTLGHNSSPRPKVQLYVKDAHGLPLPNVFTKDLQNKQQRSDVFCVTFTIVQNAVKYFFINSSKPLEMDYILLLFLKAKY